MASNRYALPFVNGPKTFSGTVKKYFLRHQYIGVTISNIKIKDKLNNNNLYELVGRIL